MQQCEFCLFSYVSNGLVLLDFFGNLDMCGIYIFSFVFMDIKVDLFVIGVYFKFFGFIFVIFFIFMFV